MSNKFDMRTRELKTNSFVLEVRNVIKFPTGIISEIAGLFEHTAKTKNVSIFSLGIQIGYH
jgi:hypothetical protein